MQPVSLLCLLLYFLLPLLLRTPLMYLLRQDEFSKGDFFALLHLFSWGSIQSTFLVIAIQVKEFLLTRSLLCDIFQACHGSASLLFEPYLLQYIKLILFEISSKVLPNCPWVYISRYLYPTIFHLLSFLLELSLHFSVPTKGIFVGDLQSLVLLL